MSSKLLLPRIGVGAVIWNENDEILLVLRNRNPEKDKWSIPGGKVDPFESLESCVIREVMEEVNLEVEIQGLLCMAETIRPEHEEHWISAIYEVVVKSGEARNMESTGAIADMKWCSLDELPDRLACFTVPAIEQLQRRRICMGKMS
ncbi:NUDIX domain-containing protein [Paenibacillus arenosi]|uniref:NUDIX domain-containing protein n=1 Tax=Paenibacillus arenosi TaxID=2774142 RepID=A0ABR9B120_9BACL|nr:NUDIX domain-containing protein [Paenibacillus arenosi]MBD8500055.1 NUDIX domain-containing protein [Paenibacillus arenosi]